jgi:Putative prokaryotic signal transducing protein
MVTGRAQPEQRMLDMPDQELLGHMAKDLTELARDAPLEVAHGHGPLQVCARFLSPFDAQVLAACLQNAGLAAHVMDTDSIFASGALLGSLPRGGVRVVVPQSQLEDALRIRAEFDAGELAIDEDFDVGEE